MDDMNKRFRAKLHLSEKERLVVKIDKEELSDTLVACQYLLAARVLTNKSVNKDAFIEVFTTLWCGEQGVSIKDIGECRFVARFTSLRDKKMVLDMEPWNFRNSLVLLVDVKRGGNFRTFDITHAMFWVQFYGIPPLDMTVAVARKIGGFIGRVLDVDQLEGPDHIGGFVRVRIQFDVTQPLMRGAFVEFPEEGKKWIEFSYEHLPAYCLICGCLRHTANVCEERIREELKAEGMQGEITLFYGFSHLDVKDLKDLQRGKDNSFIDLGTIYIQEREQPIWLAAQHVDIVTENNKGLGVTKQLREIRKE
ncbi:hypothetical protein CerSpe_243250 [Prunus speciosa]